MTATILAVAFAAAVYLLAQRHARSLEQLTALHDQRIDRLVTFQQSDKDRWDTERRGLHDLFVAERQVWEAERCSLLNRIKPETRQFAPRRVDETPQMLQPVAYDDDDAWQTELESREALADRLAGEELNGRAG